MKIKVLLAIVVCSALTAGAVLANSAGAVNYTAQVTPLVDVDAGGSLTITGGTGGPPNNVLDFGHAGPGTNVNRTLNLNVASNGPWTLTVYKNQDLTDSTKALSFPSSDLTFSASGPAGPTYASGAQIGAFASPTNVATNGTAATTGAIDVVYSLSVSPSQPPGHYSASHTYTLIIGP